MTQPCPLDLGRLHARPLLVFLAGALGAFGVAAADLTAHGNFRHMSRTGDTAGRVPLAALSRQPGAWGVGATAGLLGEVVQIDGQLLVSPGSDPSGRVRPPLADEQAVLFAGASVASWREMPVTQDLSAQAFEVFLVEAARAAGLPADAPFVFRVEGRFPHLLWHVVTGETASATNGAGPEASDGSLAAHPGLHGTPGHGHANARAGLRLFRQPGSAGQLVGVYSGVALEGVVSHPGERLHLHYVDQGATVSGHVDRFSIAAGAVLRVPAP